MPAEDKRTTYSGNVPELPQELIDHIMKMLQDDLLTLKACSLACKAMFASTRHLIHRTLSVTHQNNIGVLTHEEWTRYLGRGGDNLELHFLSYMAQRGLLRYTQHVYVGGFYGSVTFTPRILLPHLHYFRLLDQVHTLTIEHCDLSDWAPNYEPYFNHFYPTLTSLTLRHTYGHPRLILRFALQFPNLENLRFEWLKYDRIPAGMTTLPIIDQSPPLRGDLRLAGLDHTMDPARELWGRMNFRSVEIEDSPGDYTQHMLGGCAGTIETLTFIPLGTGHRCLGHLRFLEMTALRRLTIRTVFTQVYPLSIRCFPISTITSPLFSEFVFELGGDPSDLNGKTNQYWGSWKRIDELFVERFARRGNFKFILRTGELHDKKTFQKHTRETFPLLASRGCIHFETSFGEKCRY